VSAMFNDDVKTLGRVLSARREPGEFIAWTGGCRDNNSIKSYITFGQLQQHVADLMVALGDCAGEKWALYCDDSYQFLVGLLAMLHCDVTPVLPMNIQSGVIERLSNRVDGFLSDGVLDPNVENDHFSVILLPLSPSSFPVSSSSTLLHPHSETVTLFVNKEDFSARDIEIYTSGSTGDPEVIVKKIGHFEEEINTLEKCWSDNVRATACIATVSHQHIYGLLFRLLWPVCTERVFFSKRFEFPEDMAAAIQSFVTQTGLSVVIVSSPAHIKRVSENAGLTGIGGCAPITFSSGGPLAFEANMQYQSITTSQVVEMFGSSETGGVGHRSIPQGSGECEKHLYWVPFTGVDLELVDGLLKVKSKHCVAGGEWFRMGDKVELLSDGRFLLRGRADRIAKIEEKRVSLSGVETVLLQHDWLNEVQVVVLDGKRQTLGVVACLSDQGLEQLQFHKKRAVVNLLREHLATFFEAVVLPRKWRFVTAMPINAQGKTVVSDLCALFEGEEK